MLFTHTLRGQNLTKVNYINPLKPKGAIQLYKLANNPELCHPSLSTQ